VTQWRSQLAQSTSGCSRQFSHSCHKAKSFVRHETEDGLTFYTVAKKGEGKQMPRQLDSSELFSMPNLILDLDAASSHKIREYTAEDSKQIGEFFSISEKSRRASQTITKLETLVKDSRKASLNMASDTTNPWRVSNHDIMSIAIRGALNDAGTLSHLTSSSDGKGLRVLKLSQSHKEGYASNRQEIFGHSSAAAENDTYTKLGQVAEDDKSRRKSDRLRKICLANGIPGHASKSEEQLMRWMLVKRESLGYAKSKMNQSPPTAVQLAHALRSQHSIAEIRRVVFHSLQAGFDWGADSSQKTKNTRNLHLELEDACVRCLDGRHSGDSHREALIFINNLTQAVPHVGKDLEICISALRQKCLSA
jgi:hypothetical protein